MVQIRHVALTLAFLEWKSKPLFFSYLFSVHFLQCFVFVVLCNLFWALFLTQNPILPLVLFSKRWANFAFGHSNVQENERYNLWSFVFQKIWLFLPAIWYTGFVLFHFPGALKDQQCCLPLVCAVACSTVWLSPGCFISVSLWSTSCLERNKEWCEAQFTESVPKWENMCLKK